MPFVALLALVFLAACGPSTDAPPPSADTGSLSDSTANLARFFPDETTGTFLLYDAQSGVTTRFGATAERRTPASTFKIFNSLVALDAGAVADEHEVIAWDGVERWVRSWNQDQTLETAFQRSALWTYQELARRTGRDTLQAWLDRESYGNTTLGDSLEWSWIDGSLRISPEEQVTFLRRLRAGETSFSDRAERIVRRIMVADTTDGTVLRGKTGWSLREGENLGWWTGWLERGDETYFFATTVESDNPDFDMISVRKQATESILAHLGIR